MLSNLSRCGGYFYCFIEDCNLDSNYIRINIYLSCMNIVKEVETLIKMIISDDEDFEN